MGMDSKRLSERVRQPGHDRSFERSEKNFIEAARACLGDAYELTKNPSDLRAIFGEEAESALGLSPEASITSKITGRKFFVEVKKQGLRGNAEERACKHHTVQFYKLLNKIYKYNYHPYITIMCESLAESERYTRKFKYLIEENQYLLWKKYDSETLCNYLRSRCAAWID